MRERERVRYDKGERGRREEKGRRVAKGLIEGERVRLPGDSIEDSSDVRLVVLTRRAKELRIERFRVGKEGGEEKGKEARVVGGGSRYLDMEMGCFGANAKLESINFTPQVTAIGGEGIGGFGNSLI